MTHLPTHNAYNTPADVGGWPSPAETDPNRDGYKVVRCIHTPENAQAVADALRDCDVLAFENPEVPTAKRAASEQDYTYALSADFARLSPASKEQWRRDHIKNAFYKPVLAALEASGQQVHFIDINPDHPKYGLREYSARTYFRLHTAALYANVDEMKRLVLEDASTMGELNRERDAVDVLQLQALQKQYPGKRIGPVVGVNHAIDAELAKDTPVEPVIIGCRPTATGRLDRVGYREDIQNCFRDDPNAVVDPDLLNRAVLLELYSIRRHILEARHPGLADLPEADQYMYMHTEIVDKLSPEQVAGMLQTIDKIRTSRIAQVLGSTPMRLNNLLEKAA